MDIKVKTAALSIISNSILIALKLIVGLFTGSVSIISEAIHSSMDLLAAIIAFFSVKNASKPADEHHQYGHGKIENVSGVVESILIFIASLWIIIESIKKILNPTHIESVGLGFIVMFISAVVNFLVSKRLYKIAKQEDSIALEADALHLKADVYTSLGVGIGLFLIWLTGLTYLDPIVGILVALFILKESYEMLTLAFNPLLDTRLLDEDLAIIKREISKFKDIYCDFHDLRTRRSGNRKYIDLHLLFPPETTVKEAHDLCDKIEKSIEEAIINTEVLIHMEPCEKEGGSCNS